MSGEAAAGRRAGAIGTAPATSALRLAGLVLVLAMVLLRVLASHAPELVFDIDPLLAAGAQPALGPAGSLLVDVVLVAGAALILAAEIARGAGLAPPFILLALLPLPIVVMHGLRSADDLVLGSAWSSAVIAAVAIAHACRDCRMRTLVVAILLAAAAPLAFRGAWQLLVEHEATVRLYRATREAFLAARGWSPESPQARLYEERLFQPEAIGWFGLSNVYSSIMVALALAWCGLAMASWRRRLPSGWTALAALVAIACATLVVVNGGKGATGALAIGLVLFALAAWRLGPVQRFGRVILVLLPLLGLLAVVGRGLAPEDIGGERSLLFRWQYLVGAVRVMSDHWLIGAGPAGFRDAYLVVRLPRAPEEIGSAHSAFADWIAALGLLGLAWVVLVAWFLVRATCSARGSTSETRRTAGAGAFAEATAEEDPEATSRGGASRRLVVLAAVALLGPLIAFWIEVGMLDAVDSAVRLGAIALWFGLAFLVSAVLERATGEQTWLNWAFAVVVSVLLLHAQIEMTLWLPASALFILVLVGAIAGAPAARNAESARRLAWIAPALVGALGVSLFVGAWLPAARQQRLVIDAATPLHALARERRTSPSRPPLDRGAADRVRERDARLAAARALHGAWKAWPINDLVEVRAIEQLLAAAQLSTGPERSELAREAMDWSMALVASRGTARALRIAASAAEARASIEPSPATWLVAFDCWSAVIPLDPQGMFPRWRAAEAAEQAGRIADAVTQFERVLEIDRNLVHDPRKQLTAAQREAIEQRLERLRGAAEESAP